MSDEAVAAKTGRAWAAWFAVLDRAQAIRFQHREIVTLLGRKFAVPGWWSQMITVEYERARGLRKKHETANGYAISVSRTLTMDLRKLYEAAASAQARWKWFPAGEFRPTSQIRNKYFRGTWDGSSRPEIGFYAKGANKAQIAIQIGKLKKSGVEVERRKWKAAMERVAAIAE